MFNLITHGSPLRLIYLALGAVLVGAAVTPFLLLALALSQGVIVV